MTANPLEVHHRVLDLLVLVVHKDAAKFLIAARFSALLIPVHGLELLLEGDDGAVHVPGLF